MYIVASNPGVTLNGVEMDEYIKRRQHFSASLIRSL